MLLIIATATFRVANIALKDTSTCEVIAPANYDELLWRVLDCCVVPAERRVSSGDMPMSLTKIEVVFPFDQPGNASILGPLATQYPALLSSLHMLTIENSDYDESTALGTFAAEAANLRELTFFDVNLTSVRCLEGHCELLRKVNLAGCKHLANIDGLGDRPLLQEVNVSGTAITDIDPLRTCPALVVVYFINCEELSSIEALADHHCLQEVDASYTAISTIEPLRSCPALTTVILRECQQLSSIQALEGHQRLQEVNIGFTPVASIEPLRTCPALTKVDLINCKSISSIEALGGHQWLEEVDASSTAITSIEPLRSCPNLTRVDFIYCEALSSIDALEDHQWLLKVDVSWSPIRSVEPLRSCPALATVVLVDCQELPVEVDLPATIEVIR